MQTTLLFYARLLPETGSVYAIADKLHEMIQSSKRSLTSADPEDHDHSWQIISTMYNSLKSLKNNSLNIGNCPLNSNSQQVAEINNYIGELDADFNRADAYINSRSVDPLLELAQRISKTTADLKTAALKQTERLLSSLSISKALPSDDG